MQETAIEVYSPLFQQKEPLPTDNAKQKMELAHTENDPRRRSLELKASGFVAICFPEQRLVSNVLNKFSFVNEEILRSQVINELRNFTSRDKVMDVRLLNTLTNLSGYYQINQGFNQSIHKHPSQLSISPPKHHNRSQQSLDDDFGGTQDNDTRRKLSAISKPVDALQTLNNPNYFWSNNGVAYELAPSQNALTGMLSAKNERPNSVAPQKIRKKLDVLLYQISR